MSNFTFEKYWWVVVTGAAICGIVALMIADLWLPEWQTFASLLFLGLVGVSFCWVYTLDRERLWWAIIPGLSGFSFMAAVLADMWYGVDPANDWLGVLVLGVGAALTGAILRQISARRVLIVVSMFCFITGVALAPLEPTLTVVLIVVVVAATAAVLWRGPGRLVLR